MQNGRILIAFLRAYQEVLGCLKLAKVEGTEVFHICAKYFSEPNKPKLKVLDVNQYKNYFALHVKNVGAKGEVTAMVDKPEFEVRWFKTSKDIKEVGGEKEADLERGSKSYVIIRRRAVIGAGQRMSDFELHSITLRFPETDQEFKYAFRITEKGVEDFSPLRRRR